MRFLLLSVLVLSCAAAPIRPEPKLPPTAFLLKGVSNEAASLLAFRIAKAAQTVPAITIQIDSFGGSIFAGMSFIQSVEHIKKTTGLRVVCAVDSKAMSMGLVILESGVCDERLMTKRSVLLDHQGSTEVSGTAEQIENELEFLRALDRAMAEVICGRTGMTIAEHELKVRGKDWTMSWAEALHFNYVDGIVDPMDIPPVQ